MLTAVPASAASCTASSTASRPKSVVNLMIGSWRPTRYLERIADRVADDRGGVQLRVFLLQLHSTIFFALSTRRRRWP